MRTHTIVISVLLCLSILLFIGVSVSAHALPVQSIPDTNAMLDSAPPQVEIFFSEALEPSFSTITIYDGDGNIVDNQDTRVESTNPRHLIVTLNPLPDGIYTVVWRVLSTVDGHSTMGSFPFAVGAVDSSELSAIGAIQEYRVSWLDIFARWVIFLSSAIFTGGLIFSLLIIGKIQPEPEIRATINPAIARLFVLALALLVSGAILAVMVQAGTATGAGIQLPWQRGFADLFLNSRSGLISMTRVTLAILITTFTIVHPSTRNYSIALALSLINLGSISLMSHSAALKNPIIPLIIDWVHLTSASIWIGGLFFFAVLMWGLREKQSSAEIRFLARLLPAFTVWALLALILIALTGIYSAKSTIGDPALLTSTGYGQTLLAKTIFLVPALILGAYHFLYITPQIKKTTADEPTNNSIIRHFRSSILIEALFGGGIIFAVAIMTVLPPAKSITEVPAIEESTQADDLQIDLSISPGRIGFNTFEIYITKDKTPLDDALEVNLLFTPAIVDLPSTEALLENKGDGFYEVQGGFLSRADTWQIQTSVRQQDAFDAYANLLIPIGIPQESTFNIPWDNSIAALLIISAFACVAISQSSTYPREALTALGLILLLTGYVLLARPAPDDPANLLNPVPPNAESIAIGSQLYQENCTACHGELGKGDGPIAETLDPPPADLTIHTAPGVHPDGQIFSWITSGVSSNSAMPSFQDVLTDEERWNLVNFLRTLN